VLAAGALLFAAAPTISASPRVIAAIFMVPFAAAAAFEVTGADTMTRWRTRHEGTAHGGRTGR
jgi:hypothetical protein